ncbi:MAG: fucose isomerase, partial [Athalassotoga sp.]
MEKIKVGIITFSDGRPKVNSDLLEINKRFQSELAKLLQSTNEIEVIEAKEIVSKPSIARSEGLRMKNEGVHLTIFNYAVWAFPHFSVIASKFAPGPFLLFGNVNPQYPGMVGMLAAAGALDQTGVIHKRVWGDIKDQKVLKQVLSFIRAAYAFNSLRGQRYGIIGGRPMGMYTAVPNVDLWNSIFGIDIEHIDQYDVVRLSIISTSNPEKPIVTDKEARALGIGGE